MCEEKFYILANKYQRKLGYYLIELGLGKPEQSIQPRFLIRWQNKLEISDAAMNFINIEREDLNKVK